MTTSTRRTWMMFALALHLWGCGSKDFHPTRPPSSRTPHIESLTAPDSLGNGDLVMAITWWMACTEDFAATMHWTGDTLVVTPVAQNRRDCRGCPYPEECPPGTDALLITSTVSMGPVPSRRFRILARDGHGYDLSLWVHGGAFPARNRFHHRVEVLRYGLPLADVRVSMIALVSPWDTLAAATTDASGIVTLEPPCSSLPSRISLGIYGPEYWKHNGVPDLRVKCGLPLQTVFHQN